VAFPVVAATAESSVNTAGTSHAVTMPAGITGDDGEIVVVLLDHGSGVASFNALAGWTELVDENLGNGITAWVRDTDGTEGATVTFTSSANTRSAHNSYRITGAEAPATQLPQLSTVATGSSTAPNATTCTPTGGAKDYLWITFFGRAGEEADDDTWVTSAPASYGTLLQKACGVAGTNLGGMMASAHRTNNAASEDAGAFTIATGAWRAYTLAVHPAAGATVSPGVIAATATVEAPGVDVGAAPGVLAAAVAVPQVTADGGGGTTTVREFDGSTHRITFATGGLSAMTFGTFAFLVKLDGAPVDSRTLLALHDSGGNFLGHPAQFDTSSDALVWHNGTGGVSWATSPADVWVMMVLRKATGTSTPRRSLYNDDTQTWTHANASGSVADWAAPGGSGDFGTHVQGSEPYQGRIAAMAAWSNTLPWSADTTGDAAIEAAGLEDALQNWVDESPSALWAFDQASVATPVDDLSATGTADQTAITGTTAITNETLAFDYTLGGGGATVTPAAIAATVAAGDVDVAVGAAPGVAGAAAAVPAPAVSVGTAPLSIAAPAALPAPLVSVAAAPTVAAAVAALLAPAVSVAAAPAVIPAIAALPAPAVSIGAAPAVAATLAALPQPAVSVAAAPNSVAAVAAAPAPAVSVGAAPAALPAVAQLPAATADGGAGAGAAVNPAVVAVVAALHAPAVSVGVAPACIAAVTVVPQAAALIGFVVTPAAITAVVALPAPAVSVSAAPLSIAVAVAVLAVAGAGQLGLGTRLYSEAPSVVPGQVGTRVLTSIPGQAISGP
jgi:hypothetical protein